MTTSVFHDRMTPGEVAKELGVAVGTLAVWRATGRYPLPWVKIGRNVYYRRQDVARFIESQTFGSAPTTGGAA